MPKLLGIVVVVLALVTIACEGGGESEFPKQGAIYPNASAAGVGMSSQIEDQGRLCFEPPEYFMKHPDGSRLGILAGTRVEILEEATCARDPNRPYKIRVIGQDIVGWVSRNYVIVDE